MAGEKACCYCERVFPATNQFFHRSVSRWDKLGAACRECQKKYRHEWQKRNSEYMLTRGRERKRRLIQMLGGVCVDCGFSGHQAAMDFDHKDPVAKRFLVSGNLNRKWEVLVEEANKCELRCANCHRIKSVESGQLGTYDSARLLDWFRFSKVEV